jgi:hypothetical protein
MGRSPFALNNSDKTPTHYKTKAGYELMDNIDRNDPNKWIHAYDERVHYGTGDPNSISNGAISRRDNYLLPEDGSLNLSLDKFKGRASVTFSGDVPAGTSVQVTFDGRVVQTFVASPSGISMIIPANVNNIGVQFIGSPSGVTTLSPFRTTIYGVLQ